MPTLGELKFGRDIGKTTDAKSRYIWFACPDCGYERWLRETNIKYNHRSGRCRECAGRKFGMEGNPAWRGGRISIGHYVGIILKHGDFFYSMVDRSGYVMEHRLVMAKHLGRCLHRWEIVHHKNHIKTDNRIENLEITVRGIHFTMHSKGYRDGYSEGLYGGHDARIKQLEARVILLEAENALLVSEKESLA